MSRARVVLLGLGGLGCPAALALLAEAAARARPLELVLIDDDRVERSNLARQTLYGPADLGRPKVEAAAEALARLSGSLSWSHGSSAPAPREASETSRMQPLAVRFEAHNALELLEGAALLLDATDSFSTRFLANDCALASGVPLIHGAALGWVGQLLTILPGGPCLRCLFEEPPPPGSGPSCAEAGVAAPLCALVGAAMADEGLRVLAGEPLRARGKLLRWDGRLGSERSIRVPLDPTCASCSAPPEGRHGHHRQDPRAAPTAHAEPV